MANKGRDMIEVVTVYRAGDSATYLASDFEKYGTDAEPIRKTQNPHKNTPWVEINLKDVEAIRKSEEYTLQGMKKLLGQHISSQPIKEKSNNE